MKTLMTLKCDACGKFISYEDFEEGRAIRHMITPDSHFTSEEYETLCKRCKQHD